MYNPGSFLMLRSGYSPLTRGIVERNGAYVKGKRAGAGEKKRLDTGGVFGIVNAHGRINHGNCKGSGNGKNDVKPA